VARRETGAWPLASSIFAIASLALLALAGVASATTGGAPTPSGSAPTPASRPGAPDPAPAGGALRLVFAKTTPRKSFYYGVRYPKLSYAVDSDAAANDLRIDVVDAAGAVVKSFYRNDVAPNVEDSVRWDGTTAEGKPARNGRYRFQIVPQNGDPAALQSLSRSIRQAKQRGARASAEEVTLNFALYGYAFPVLGSHDFGSAGAGFGAGRAGHTHQGQDVMADCGAPMVAARGGKVQLVEYHAAAGNYVVIDGKGTTLDFMYAHLLEPSPLQVGDPVRTGQPIGLVGDTGNAQGCHLHFEIWAAPGWYEGGSPVDPLPYLQRWDRYS
jgi:murein DD-endopeptidase MepM/ murein hydrolase activator NlpD